MSATDTTTMKISAIKVTRRHRKKMGPEIPELRDSLAQVGMLHPIVIDPKGRLIVGARRLRAAKALRWTTVPVRVVDTLADPRQALIAERDENACRKAFAPSERVALARDLKALEQQAAKQRQGTRTDKHPGKLPRGAAGRAKDKVARAVGTSRRTLDKMEKVIEAAEAEPEKYGDLKQRMDKEGKADGAYKELKKRQRIRRRCRALGSPETEGSQNTAPADPADDAAAVRVTTERSPDGAVSVTLDGLPERILVMSRAVLVQLIADLELALGEWRA